MDTAGLSRSDVAVSELVTRLTTSGELLRLTEESAADASAAEVSPSGACTGLSGACCDTTESCTYPMHTCLMNGVLEC